MNTIRKRHRDGLLPNTIVGSDGWRIPITDLIAAGLPPISPRAARLRNVRATANVVEAPPEDVRSTTERALREHIAALERLIATQQLHIQDLRGHLVPPTPAKEEP